MTQAGTGGVRKQNPKVATSEMHDLLLTHRLQKEHANPACTVQGYGTESCTVQEHLCRQSGANTTQKGKQHRASQIDPNSGEPGRQIVAAHVSSGSAMTSTERSLAGLRCAPSNEECPSVCRKLFDRVKLEPRV